MVPKVSAIVNLWITNYTKNIPFSQRDACSTLIRGRCPLEPGQIVTYYFTMPISRSEPNVNCDVEVSLNDRYGNAIGCAMIPVSLV